jgi:outer membrane protein
MTSAFRLPLAVIAIQLCCFGQDLWTIDRIVREAADYPSVRAGREQVNAAAAAVRLAQTAYLPRLDALAQANRATRNNVFGMLLPQSVIPPISGPPLMSNSLTSVWGSTVGMLVTWEPFDFGLRKAQVDRATAGRQQAEAVQKRTELDLRAEAAAAFMTLLAAEQTARGFEAAVARSKTVFEMVDALVRADLRPGADASRARAEVAMAETQLIQAQKAVATATAAVRQYVNGGDAPMRISAGPMIELLPQTALAGSGAVHPRIAEQQTAIGEAEASKRVLDKSWYPRFLIQGAAYARGTGAMPDGTTLGGVNGLGPNIHNWGAGFTVTFPLLEQPSLKSRIEGQEARIRSESARLEAVKRELTTEVQRAQAENDAGRRIAALMPVQLEAATSSLNQITSRYKAGLGTLDEVAEAQRLVAQAEIETALAKLSVWRALLQMAYAQGDLQTFLDAAK